MSFWLSIAKKIVDFLIIGLYIQSICFFITVPILYFWSIPLSLVAGACNIIFGPFMALFLAFCLMFFLFGRLLPEFFCLFFCKFTNLWLMTMRAIPVESLIIADTFLMMLWATCISIIFIVWSKQPRYFKSVSIVLFLYLNILAATNNHRSEQDFQLSSKVGSIQVYRFNNQINAFDNGFLSKRNGSFLPNLIRKELLLKLNCAKLDQISLLKVNLQTLENITTLAKISNLKTVEFSSKTTYTVRQRVLKKFIKRFQELGVTTCTAL